jgi:hypothetical protein
VPTERVAGLATKSAAASALFGRSHTIMNDIPQCFVCAFPFISSVDNPHIVAVCARQPTARQENVRTFGYPILDGLPPRPDKY